jgi:hypothetical protein
MTLMFDIQLSPLGIGLISIMHYYDWVSLSGVSKRYNLRMKDLATQQPGASYRSGSGLFNWYLASRAKQFLSRPMRFPIRFETSIGKLLLVLKFSISDYTNKNGVNRCITANFSLYMEYREEILSIPNSQKETKKTVKDLIFDRIDSDNTSKFKNELLHAIRSFNTLHIRTRKTKILSAHGTLKKVSMCKAKLMAYDWFCLFCRDTMVYETRWTNNEERSYGLLYLDKIYG